MNAAWDMWKKGFDAWEGATAKYLESVMKSPLLLEPAGAALSATMKAKAAREKAIAQAWAMLGLPTRRDQERILHALNQIQSRLIDLEERMEDAGRPAAPAARSPRARRAEGEHENHSRNRAKRTRKGER